jgi:MoaA/NifB/PqqE/SkfB family radical SAM enzyme/pimeloyl-ACP methyl ester carboxylesterase
MKAGMEAILIHGYTGSPTDLDPLAGALASVAGLDHVTSVTLSGHGSGETPPFDRDLFVSEIRRTVEAATGRGERVILIGHSTGGTLALSFLLETGFAPALLVLAATPKKVDTACLDRWKRLDGSPSSLSLTSVSRLAAFINSTGAKASSFPFPVLIVHGARDDLVPAFAPYAWDETDLPGKTRRVTVPGADHALFLGRVGPVARDIVRRAVQDCAAATEEKKEDIAALSALESGVSRFLKLTPGSVSHLGCCPAALLAQEKEIHIDNTVPWDPVFVNVEITTRCNLACVYCARQKGTGPKGLDMPKDLFAYLIGLMPHAYRVTLVGLGEPLLHPDVIDMVAHAAENGRRVGLVTNAMCLDKALSRELLRAGLSAIVFSLDSADQATALELRPGSDMPTITNNIRGFVDACRAYPDVSLAVFSALSVRNIGQFDRLVALASDLGVHVLMATDLNFREHAADSVWAAANSETRSLVRTAVARAFARRLPVLSVHGLEAFGLFHRYRDFLPIPPESLYQRSDCRRHCVSPWQTLPISVEGRATVCDCRPDVIAGDLTSQPLSTIWNGESMQALREAMVGSNPPPDCTACPRF